MIIIFLLPKITIVLGQFLISMYVVCKFHYDKKYFLKHFFRNWWKQMCGHLAEFHSESEMRIYY